MYSTHELYIHSTKECIKLWSMYIHVQCYQIKKHKCVRLHKAKYMFTHTFTFKTSFSHTENKLEAWKAQSITFYDCNKEVQYSHAHFRNWI